MGERREAAAEGRPIRSHLLSTNEPINGNESVFRILDTLMVEEEEEKEWWEWKERVKSGGNE